MGIKYKVNENFFKKWSEEMAYVLGYIYADGSLEDASYLRGKYIRVSSAEKNNIVKIRNWMESEHSITERESKYKNGKKTYLLRIGSHVLYNDLLNIGLYPNKSLTITFPKIPKKYLGHFIRGYFDGDGCVRMWRNKNKKGDILIKKLSTIFTSGSKVFLQDLALNIQKISSAKQLNVYNGHRSFMLSYSSSDSVEIFKLMYGSFKKPIFLERKAHRFVEYFELRPKRVDKRVKSILQYLGS